MRKRPRIPFTITGFEEHDVRELRFVLETKFPVKFDADVAFIEVNPQSVVYLDHARIGKVGRMVEEFMATRKPMPVRLAPPRLQFTAYVTPQPQGSIKAYVRGGRPVLTCDNAKMKPCRSEIASCAIEAMKTAGLTMPLAAKHVPVRLDAKFYFERPKSVKRLHHTVKPDRDKLLRMLSDALTGIVYADDAQVCAGPTEKLYGSPARVEVTATVIEEAKWQST